MRRRKNQARLLKRRAADAKAPGLQKKRPASVNLGQREGPSGGRAGASLGGAWPGGDPSIKTIPGAGFSSSGCPLKRDHL